jgi:signal transduction histidine kinase
MNLGNNVGRLPRPLETALFRIVQESLTNVHRHASTSTASIRLMSAADTVVLEIQDHGRGLRDDRRSAHGDLLPVTLGVGIQGMRERIRQLGGMFDVEFTERGTTVRVSVPVERAHT